MRREEKPPVDPDLRTGLQWGLGCLVGGAALGGTVILVFLVAVAVQPPAWVQIVLGIGLVAGSIVLAWLFTSALRRSQESSSRPPASLRRAKAGRLDGTPEQSAGRLDGTPEQSAGRLDGTPEQNPEPPGRGRPPNE